MLPLQTERLTLREIEKGDFAAIHSYSSDPQVTSLVPFGPNEEEDTHEFIERAIGERTLEPRNDYILAVVLRDTGQLVGDCGLHIQYRNTRKAYLGCILHRDFWNCGYATEITRALLKFGFEELKLHKIFARTFVTNAASVNVLRKAGMKCEAHYRHDHFVRGEWIDIYSFAILEDEWGG